ncbi:type IV toxin-antitoxin system AbiEi family antitoxin domain-containing protein [Massilia sp. G4R7]|uniref:Type IV toxin-antitoxin system AbiEi family antitoxin domain-containing protein n=1 Tax=Massilia phyllostachyos TaxID=2898585 RepID=A0ABS8QDQ8_9BURK|nr:type IV toxin-antitoxin system AbiEi family antitoxin domain-containing protein [Massilia phyllostachyos]MCD2519181.1 type IV toxin-antitoxin system AbiEi family antitoxin domain-containing protein [Massilia phyllostachyos]
MSQQAEQILELARSKGILRTRDVDSVALPRVLLASLTDEGRLLKLGRGLYTLPDRAASEHDSFAEVATRSENGVLCLFSALRFHDLTTQQPSDVWLAIPHKARAPRFDYPPIRIVRMSGLAMTEGVETADVGGAQVRVFGVAKTVADCFKFRNKIGLDVALEALREAWNGKRTTMEELWRHAEICRVANVMRPYLETVAAA